MKTKSTFFTGLFVILFAINSISQPVDDPLHENHFRQVDPIETELYKIEISDAHAQQEFCYLKLHITNKSGDYLLVHPEEFIFSFEHGLFSPAPKGNLMSALTGELIVDPYETKSFVTKVTGSGNFHVEEFNLKINGIYKVSKAVEPLTSETFQLPANKNSFKVGDYTLNLLSLKQQTDETVAKFNCTYTGDGVGIIDPTKLIVTTEKGEYANDYRRMGEKVILKGEDVRFIARFVIEPRILDMQFATMQIDWKDMFKESDRELLTSHKINFVIDPDLTEKNNFKYPR